MGGRSEAELEQRLRTLSEELEVRQVERNRIEFELRRRRDLENADLRTFLKAKEAAAGTRRGAL